MTTSEGAKKILHVVSNRWNSAIAEYALSACRATILAGFKESLLVPLTGSPVAERATFKGLSVSCLDRMGVAAVFQAKKLVDDFKPDLIFVYGGPETLLMAAATAGKVPLIRFRGYGIDEGGFATSFTHDLGLPGVRQIIAPSEHVAGPIRRISNIPVEVITLGVDEQIFVPPPIFEVSTRPSMLIFGRFDPVKGHREFLKILSLIKDSWPTSKTKLPVLNIVGQPANLSVRHLQEWCLEFGLLWNDDVVVQAERVSSVATLLAGQTLGVISSVGSEYICRVAQEFLLCGTPVAVSGVGSLKEILVRPMFGVSYEGMSDLDVAKSLTSKLLQYHAESPVNRKDRAIEAKKLFALDTMAKSLKPMIDRVLVG